MAYVTTNPPQQVWHSLGSGGRSGWYYASTDPSTDVDAVDYFSNGDDLGMRVGDIVYVVDTDTGPTATLHSVSAVTAGGAATIV